MPHPAIRALLRGWTVLPAASSTGAQSLLSQLKQRPSDNRILEYLHASPIFMYGHAYVLVHLHLALQINDSALHFFYGDRHILYAISIFMHCLLPVKICSDSDLYRDGGDIGNNMLMDDSLLTLLRRRTCSLADFPLLSVPLSTPSPVVITQRRRTPHISGSSASLYG
jgi:hypothetical protein